MSAALRAKHQLQAAWDRIDYTEDVIKPTLAEIRALEANSEVEVTEGDLLSILTTGTLSIEQGQ